LGSNALSYVRDFLALNFAPPCFGLKIFALIFASIRCRAAPLLQHSVYGGRHDMNRPAPKTLRRRFFVPLGHAIHVTWPVLSALLAVQLALGLLTGFVEGWSLGDAVYFTFITGITIGYGDLVRRQALTRALAIGIGFFGALCYGSRSGNCRLRHALSAH
jgi:hypothetical protein